MYIPDRGSLADNYLVAQNFADWLTKIRYFSIHGGFENVSVSDREGKMGNERTWSLLRRLVAKFEDLEQVEISREGRCLYLCPILECFTCPNLKTLQIGGISEWKHGPIELGPEVRIPFTIDILKIRTSIELLTRLEMAHCIFHIFSYIRLRRTA